MPTSPSSTLLSWLPELEASRKHTNRISYTYRTSCPSDRSSWRRHTPCPPAQRSPAYKTVNKTYKTVTKTLKAWNVKSVSRKQESVSMKYKSVSREQKRCLGSQRTAISYTYRTYYPCGRRSWRRHMPCPPAQRSPAYKTVRQVCLGSRYVCIGSRRVCLGSRRVCLGSQRTAISYTYRTCHPCGRRSWRHHTP